MSYYYFDCGCRVDLVDEQIKSCDGLPSLCIDYDNLNDDCPDVWELFGSGRTKGVFQLESRLGQSWAAKVRPHNLMEISAIIAMIRPGVLKAMFGKKNMAQHYVDRKHGVDEVTYLHPALEPILKAEYGILLYQEQSMRIATDIAGFSLQEADNLRKGLGKKDAKLVAQIRGQFTSGCATKNIVDPETSETIYDWIEKGNRYLFNQSHSCCYGGIGYWCAWVKQHFPLHFFAVWLHHAKDKLDPQEEIRELIFDAKNFNIPINPPSFIKMAEIGATTSICDGQIYFNGGDIKGIGEKQIEKLAENVLEVEKKLGKRIKDWSWYDLLIHYSPLTNKTVMNGLIASGALSHLGISRAKMLFDYKHFEQLSAGEKRYVIEHSSEHNCLRDCVQDVLDHKVMKNRKEVVLSILKELDEPPYSLKDTMKDICGYESQLLGVPITYSTTELLNSCDADTTCKEFIDGKTGKMSIAVEIKTFRSFPIKNGKQKGKKMAIVSGNDETANLDCFIVFPDVLSAYQDKIYVGNVVVFHGEKNFRNNQFSFVVTQVEQV